jgi:hypothetical protein
MAKASRDSRTPGASRDSALASSTVAGPYDLRNGILDLSRDTPEMPKEVVGTTLNAAAVKVDSHASREATLVLDGRCHSFLSYLMSSLFVVAPFRRQLAFPTPQSPARSATLPPFW